MLVAWEKKQKQKTNHIPLVNQGYNYDHPLPGTRIAQDLLRH